MDRKDQQIRLSEISEISRLIKSPEVDEVTKRRAVRRLTELALQPVNSDVPNNQSSQQPRTDIEIEYGVEPRTPDELEQAISQLYDKQKYLTVENNIINNYLVGANAGTWRWSPESGDAFFSEQLINMTGYELDDFSDGSGLKMDDIIHPDDVRAENEKLQKCIDGSDIYCCEVRVTRKDGKEIWIEDKGRVFERDSDGKAVLMLGTSIDITERKTLEKYQKLNSNVLKLINKSSDAQSMTEQIVEVIEQEKDIDAVGIRLKDSEDYPYHAQRGFPSEFLQTENSLIEYSNLGEVCRDSNGNSKLECTCGLILSGKIDPNNPLFTEYGSFWTNNSTSMLDLPIEQDPRYNPRNHCVHFGYGSIALIPIKNVGEIVGLLQINSHNEGMFSQQIIDQLEETALHIGEAIVRKKLEESLAISAERLALATRAGGVGIWDYDVSNNKLEWDEQMYALYGISPDDFAGAYESWRDGIHPDDMERGDNEIQMALRGENEFNTEFRVQWPDGTIHHIRALSYVQRDSTGKPLRMIGTNWDITNQKQLNEELIESREKFSKLFELNPSACGLSDVDTGEYTELNDAFYKLLGYKKDEVIGKTPFELGIISKETAKVIIEQAGIKGTIIDAEADLITKNGDVLHVLLSAENIVIGGVEYRYTVVNDITEFRELQDKIYELTLHDELTGLGNRRLLKQEYEKLEKSGRKYPISLITGDILDFKIVNDTFGHNAGDEVLKEISKILQEELRSDDIIIRMGGDEFVALLPLTDEKTALVIQKRIETRLATEKTKHPVKLSMGIATSYQKADYKDFDEFLTAADKRMYENKRFQKGI